MIDLHEGVRELFLDAQTYTVERVYAAVAARLCAEDVSVKAYHKKSYDKRRVEVLAQKAEYRAANKTVLRIKFQIRRRRAKGEPVSDLLVKQRRAKGYAKHRSAECRRVLAHYAANRDAINAKRRARYAALRSK